MIYVSKLIITSNRTFDTHKSEHALVDLSISYEFINVTEKCSGLLWPFCRIGDVILCYIDKKWDIGLMVREEY